MKLIWQQWSLEETFTYDVISWNVSVTQSPLKAFMKSWVISLKFRLRPLNSSHLFDEHYQINKRGISASEKKTKNSVVSLWWETSEHNAKPFYANFGTQYAISITISEIKDNSANDSETQKWKQEKKIVRTATKTPRKNEIWIYRKLSSLVI